jgi:hypothetical protein
VILGIDPGGRKVTVFSGTEGVTFEAKPGERYGQLQYLDKVLRLHFALLPEPIERIYCEEPVVAGRRNLRVTIQIAETVGMVLSVGPPVTLVPVSSWKKVTVGKGNATKDDVKAWFKQAYPESLQFGNQDVCDAAAIHAYGLQDMDLARKLVHPGGDADTG